MMPDSQFTSSQPPVRDSSRTESDPARLIHDLANLLDGSLRNVSLALRRLDDAAREPDDRTCDWLRTAEQTMAQMAHLLKGWHAGADEAMAGPTDLTIEEAVRQTIQLFGAQADSKGIGLYEDLDPAVLSLPAGPLVRVLANAVRNSLEAILHDGNIWIRADRLNDGQVEVRIEDDGPGVDPYLARDRDGLVLAGQTTKATSSGHGLGLAICRDLVRANGGVIRLESREGGGTVLLIRLPVVGEVRA